MSELTPLKNDTAAPSSPKSNRALLTVITLLLTIGAVLNFADHYADIKLNESLEQGVVAFASVRSIHAVISMLKGTEISVPFLTVSVGEILSPATEILQSTSTVLTTALASLGLQKILLDVFSAKLVNITIAISAFAYLVTLWVSSFSRFLKFTQSLFFVLCLTRYLLVGTLLLNSLVDTLFLNEQTEQITQQTDFIATDLHQFNQQLIDGKAAEYEEDDSLLGSAKRTWNNVTNGFEQTKQEMQQSFDELQEKTESLVINLLTLIAMFTLKTILIPIGFLLLLKNLYWSLIKRLSPI
ncbi:hypothetical protein AB4343_08735 [Vibrio breoganii]|uniref:Uncharacterized protein n=1 Tax=Vibrio breoganii TaxID=553239 RepID=A0AAJ3VPX8_9VIBR|nr:hypothetical protein [Vibrio breoganii]ANO33330.1 hypothetical protein A6E01_08925 [Vibrio breoganii]MDN3716698.1 hypothetical protein [Vibrio breoganii]OCH74599.1 hypothetical protein A6D95_13685 [Vibrio breoganii]OED96049.1 hypothetical protein A1QE_03520 [Vibrio breoganii ZF-55]PMF92300.1 hypothetical protein BCV08_11830 [Vibrio breoganii]